MILLHDLFVSTDNMKITLMSFSEVNILTCQIELSLQNIMQCISTSGNLPKNKYRLTINIPAPSVFRYEFQSTVSNFLSWCINVFRRHCLC